jgi:hypothetical protein
MLKPENAVECWFVGEDKLQQSLNLGNPFEPSHPFPYAYFQRINKPDDDTLEGYLGHSNLHGDFHDQITSNYSYFDEYKHGKYVFHRSAIRGIDKK